MAWPRPWAAAMAAHAEYSRSALRACCDAIAALAAAPGEDAVREKYSAAEFEGVARLEAPRDVDSDETRLD